MEKLLRSMTSRRKARHSVAAALSTSAAVPNSGFVFVDNSQGGSAAVGELSHALDTALDGIEGDFDRDLDTEDLQRKLQLLDNEAAKYANSKVDVNSEKWKCTQSEAMIVELAWKFSAAVYEPITKLVDSGFVFEELVSLSPSIGGTVKKSTMTIVSQTSSPNTADNAFLPMLVVAVRGTKSNVDMMVNLNSKGKSATDLFETHASGEELATVDEIDAHAGFLMGAEALMPQIKKVLGIISRGGKVKHVLFTGHSAGGSVASLLWLKVLRLSAKKYPNLHFSNITFGAAAVIRPADAISGTLKNANRGLQLIFVNEFDIISRADTNYVLSLADLYRSIYGLPPIQKLGGGDSTQDERTSIAPSAAPSPEVDLETKAGLVENANWRLPEPEYWHLQTIVVLKLSLKDIDTGSAEDDAEEDTAGLSGSVALTAVKVTPEEFAKLLFCRVSVHHRIYYKERVEMISKGTFNGLTGWELGQALDSGAAKK